jgi:hypothetical protein
MCWLNGALWLPAASSDDDLVSKHAASISTVIALLLLKTTLPLRRQSAVVASVQVNNILQSLSSAGFLREEHLDLLWSVTQQARRHRIVRL